MFDVKRVYLYCMGESVLDKRKFSEDTANARFSNRVQLDQTMQDFRRMQNPQTTLDQFQPVRQQPTGLAGMVQNAVAMIFRPIANAFQMAQVLPRLILMPFQMIQNTPAFAEKVISQILTFFFGNKKDRTEEKEQRERNDFAHADVFGERKVDESNQSNLGGGQR